MNDFDILRPYMIIPYALSYPMKERTLEISLNSPSSDGELGQISLDLSTINKCEPIVLTEKRQKAMNP